MERQTNDPLRLTPTEARVLKMMRAGMSRLEVCVALGWNSARGGRQISTILAQAREKEKLRILDEERKPSGRGSGTATLSQARGRVRQAGGVG